MVISFQHVDGTIQFWDIKRGLCINTLTTEGRICNLAVVQNGIILAYLYDRTFQIWNDYGEGSSRVIQNNDYSTFYHILFLSNGDVACISGQVDCKKLIEDDYQSSRTLKNREEGYIENFNNISNNLFYSLSSEPTALNIYDICKDYRCVYTIEERLVPSIVINNMLFITNNDIRILDIHNEYKCLHCLEGHRGYVNDLLFIEKNILLLSGSKDCTIKVWDANNNYCCIRTVDTDGFFGKFMLMKNGYFAAVINFNEINIWDSACLRRINILELILGSLILSYLKIIESYLMHLMELF
jgi:WD40 repeat protein